MNIIRSAPKFIPAYNEFQCKKKFLHKVLLITSLISLLFIDIPLSQTDQLKKSESHISHPIQQPDDVMPHNQALFQPPTIDYTTFTSSAIDVTISNRLTYTDNPNKCDRILLFMPYFFAGHGQGFQMNCYLMAAVMAAYMDMALVIFEPPREENRFDTGSQFGCPADMFVDQSRSKIKDGFPEGLLRLIQHPKWISRGCGVPTCQGTRNYSQWVNLKKQYKRHFGWGRSKKYVAPLEFSCVEGGRNITVWPMDGADVRTAWDRTINAQMVDRSSQESRDRAYHWAIRLGSSHSEAEYFTTLRTTEEISDFIGALVNRSGLLQLQPYIARDVEKYIQMSNIDINTSYDAIHVRRGDKLIAEAKKIVQNYWMKKGYKNKNDLPTNYVPLQHYLELGYDGSVCPVTKDGRRRKVNTPHRVVFVATDDPSTVQNEIAQLPKTQFGHTILNECQKARFVFSPMTKTTNSFHMTPCQKYLGTCQNDDCARRYDRNIAAMADLFILTRADKFIGEYNSNWGRLVKGFRTIFRPNYNGMPDRSSLMVRDVVEVFGYKPTFFSY